MTRKVKPESAEEVRFFVREFAMCGEASTWMLENAHCGLRQLWEHCERADWLAFVAQGLFNPRFVIPLLNGFRVCRFGHVLHNSFRLADRETTTRAHAKGCAKIRARYTYAEVRRRARQEGYLP